MRLEILAPRIVRLVGGDERQAPGVGEIEQRRLELLFFRQRMALQLDIEPVAEQPGKPFAARRRKLGLAGREREVERPAGSAGQHDQARGLLERGELDVRPLARRGVEEGARGEPHQVAIAILARRQQDEARQPRRMALMARRLLVAEIDAERAADDRLDARTAQLVGEFERAEHVVAVGQGERGLAVGLGELGELADGQRALEQRVGRMHMQVHEAGVGHAGSS